MKKTYSVLAFLAVTFVFVASDVYGEDEIYYCAETDSNGFNYNEKRGSYEPRGFKGKKFKMKLDIASKTIELAFENRKEKYKCEFPFRAVEPDLMSCIEKFYLFNFNAKNGRFVYFVGYGYVGAEGKDSIGTSYGTCDKF